MKRVHGLLALMGFLLCLAGTVSCGGRASAPELGESIGGPEAQSVRVLSLNLHTYQEADALRKLEDVARGAAAMHADILLLQEVGEHLTDLARPNAGAVIRDHLERLTGSAWAHEWRNAHIGFDEYREGLSIISRTPLSGVREDELSGGALRRIALTATTDVRGIALEVCTVHTTWPEQGDAETQRLLEVLAARQGAGARATIVGGDFNAEPGSPQIARILAAGFVDAAREARAEAATFGSPPDRRIDYQFFRANGGASPPRIAAVLPVFGGNTNGDAGLPRVSDHLGLLVVYDFAAEISAPPAR